MPENNPRRCLNEHEAADYVRLAPTTLRWKRCKGGGPLYAKLGRRVVYTTADLDAWLEANLRASTKAP